MGGVIGFAPVRLEWPPTGDWREALWLHGALVFCRVPCQDDNRPLHLIAESLGPPSLRALPKHPELDDGRGVQWVRSLAQPVRDRFGESLRSAGSEAFALHTDEAFFLEPCRWVLLHCWRPDPEGGGDTCLSDLKALSDLLPAAMLSRPLPYPCGRLPTLSSAGAGRFNREALDSAQADGQDLAAANQIAAALAQSGTRLALAAGDLLLIDNWRIAHGREPFAANSPRALKRLRLINIER